MAFGHLYAPLASLGIKTRAEKQDQLADRRKKKGREGIDEVDFRTRFDFDYNYAVNTPSKTCARWAPKRGRSPLFGAIFDRDQATQKRARA